VFNDLSALERARTGQIQTSDVTVPTHVSSLQGIQIQSVACGEAHVLAFSEDGKDQGKMLWAWG
jgi:alpha-tubulin suppressor-like RCC1 family protein